jgi:hypothetical protein
MSSCQIFLSSLLDPCCQISLTEFQRLLMKDTSLHYIPHSHLKYIQFNVGCCHVTPIFLLDPHTGIFSTVSKNIKDTALCHILHSHHNWKHTHN